MSSLKSLFFERINKLLTSHIAEYVTKIVVLQFADTSLNDTT